MIYGMINKKYGTQRLCILSTGFDSLCFTNANKVFSMTYSINQSINITNAELCLCGIFNAGVFLTKANTISRVETHSPYVYYKGICDTHQS